MYSRFFHCLTFLPKKKKLFSWLNTVYFTRIILDLFLIEFLRIASIKNKIWKTGSKSKDRASMFKLSVSMNDLLYCIIYRKWFLFAYFIGHLLHLTHLTIDNMLRLSLIFFFFIYIVEWRNTKVNNFAINSVYHLIVTFLLLLFLKIRNFTWLWTWVANTY